MENKDVREPSRYAQTQKQIVSYSRGCQLGRLPRRAEGPQVLNVVAGGWWLEASIGSKLAAMLFPFVFVWPRVPTTQGEGSSTISTQSLGE